MPQPLRLRMRSIRSHDRIARPAILYEVVYRVLLNLASQPTLHLFSIYDTGFRSGVKMAQSIASQKPVSMETFK